MNTKSTDKIDEIKYLKKQSSERIEINSTWDNSIKHFHNAINSEWYKNISLIMGSILNSSFTFYQTCHYTPVCLPITCGSVSSPMGLGSDSVPVKVNLFDENVYLADSMQFHLEYQLRQGFEGVFYIMPSFRGEDSDARHLNQFFHSEAEIKGDLNDVMILVEQYIKSITQSIYEGHADQIHKMAGSVHHVEKVLDSDYAFPRISFKEAINLLNNNSNYFKFIKNAGNTITNLGEQALIRYFNGPVWLTHCPSLTVPFYQAYNKQDPDYSLTADLLMGIGETVGCGERHKNYKELENSLSAHQVNKENYKWYLQLKQDYPLQTAGFGMGIERFVLWLIKHNDIRDIPLLNRLKGIQTYV